MGARTSAALRAPRWRAAPAPHGLALASEPGAACLPYATHHSTPLMCNTKGGPADHSALTAFARCLAHASHLARACGMLNSVSAAVSAAASVWYGILVVRGKQDL